MIYGTYTTSAADNGQAMVSAGVDLSDGRMMAAGIVQVTITEIFFPLFRRPMVAKALLLVPLKPKPKTVNPEPENGQVFICTLYIVYDVYIPI